MSARDVTRANQVPAGLTIITNHQPRLVLDWNQLTDEERERFSYRTDPDTILGTDGDFVRYRGYAYDLGDMMSSSIPGWDLQADDTAFSAILFKLDTNDRDRVIAGFCYA